MMPFTFTIAGVDGWMRRNGPYLAWARNREILGQSSEEYLEVEGSLWAGRRPATGEILFDTHETYRTANFASAEQVPPEFVSIACLLLTP